MIQTVLLVDDDEALLAALARSLRRERYRILSAPSATAAVDLLQHEAVDVVVSDDQMPGVTGVEFLAQIRHLFPGTVRLMLTGKASVEGMARAVNDGHIYRFLTKPCPHEVLTEAVAQALDHKLLMDRCREALLFMRRQDAIIKHIARHNPAAMIAAVDAVAGIHLDDTEIDNAGEVAGQLEVQIRGLDDLPRSLG